MTGLRRFLRLQTDDGSLREALLLVLRQFSPGDPSHDWAKRKLRDEFGWHVADEDTR